MLKIFLLSLTFAYAFATLGFDITAYSGKTLNPITMQCLLKAGGQFYALESYNDVGIINQNFSTQFKYLHQYGAKVVDTMITLCVDYSPEEVCSAVAKNLPDNFNGTVWLSINTFDDECWSGTRGKFLQTLEGYAKTCQSHKLKVGIHGSASNYNWYVSGDMRRVSPFLITLPLWYEKLNKKDNFDDFSDLDAGFGGWEKPTIKKYQGSKNVCGVSVSYDFRADVKDAIDA